MSSEAEKYGWTAVPRDPAKALLNSTEVDVSTKLDLDNDFPNTPLVQKSLDYVRKELRVETFNHSMRVFHYGEPPLYRHLDLKPPCHVHTYPIPGHIILTQHFPAWLTPPFLETYALTCLFHDIGTCASLLHSTHLSFEFHGAITTLNLLKSFDAPTAQAESVCEAIIRHQDLGTTGTITRVGQLVQLATVFDNIGGHGELVGREIIEEVVERWPRIGWSGCFAATVREEVRAKPWCHTTSIEGFAEKVEGNELMARWE